MSGNDSFVQVAPDGAGKKLDTSAKDRGAGVVHAQRVVFSGDQSLSFAEPTPEGNMPITNADAQAIISLLDRIANRIDLDPATGRVRCSIDAGTLPTVTTVTTVSTVASLSSFGGNSVAAMPQDAMMNAWANNFLPCVSS